LSVANGAAQSKKLNKDPKLVYCLMGDGANAGARRAGSSTRRASGGIRGTPPGSLALLYYVLERGGSFDPTVFESVPVEFARAYRFSDRVLEVWTKQPGFPGRRSEIDE
jgi:hypothetical protein